LPLLLKLQRSGSRRICVAVAEVRAGQRGRGEEGGGGGRRSRVVPALLPPPRLPGGRTAPNLRRRWPLLMRLLLHAEDGGEGPRRRRGRARGGGPRRRRWSPVLPSAPPELGERKSRGRRRGGVGRSEAGARREGEGGAAPGGSWSSSGCRRAQIPQECVKPPAFAHFTAIDAASAGAVILVAIFASF
jgi:hypothetical protein